MTPQRRRWLNRLCVLGLIAAAIFAPAIFFGRGGVAYWSPDTFEAYSQSEHLIPLLNVPVYRSSKSRWRYDLVDHLVEAGYWSPREVEKPRWVLMFHWNEQWKDGHSILHREFTRFGESWTTWTDAHPAAAAELWPRTLTIIRTWRHGQGYAAELMIHSRHAETPEEIRRTFSMLEREMLSSGH